MDDLQEQQESRGGGNGRFIAAMALITIVVFMYPLAVRWFSGDPKPVDPAAKTDPAAADPKTDPAKTDPVKVAKADPKTPVAKADPKADPKTPVVGADPKTPVVGADPKADPKTPVAKADPKADPKTPVVSADPKADPKTPVVGADPVKPPADPVKPPTPPTPAAAVAEAITIRRPVKPSKEPIALGATGNVTESWGLSGDMYRSRLLLNPVRATITELRLSAFQDRVPSLLDNTGVEPTPFPLLGPAGTRSDPRQAESFQLTKLVVDGKDLTLLGGEWEPLPEESLAGGRVRRVFRLTVDRAGKPPVFFEKVFTLRPKGESAAPMDGVGHMMEVDFRIRCDGGTAAVAFDFLGPVGIPEHVAGDVRQVIYGRRNPNGLVTGRASTAFDKLSDKVTKDPTVKLTVPEEINVEKGETAEAIWYVGVMNHFFAAVLVPARLDGQKEGKEPGPAEWSSLELRGYHVAKDPVSLVLDTWVFAPLLRINEVTVTNGTREVGFHLYAGPKTAEAFAAAEGEIKADLALGTIIEYAQFGCCPSACGCNDLIGSLIGKPLMTLLGWLYIVIPNYGVAIVIMVLLVRVVLFPISRKGTMSMLRMKELQPKLAELQTKYGSDRQVMGQKQMELYQKEGINPIGGCLPMLLQMPIWIGLWGALSAAVDLRHAPFVSWIRDLAGPDALISWEAGMKIPLLFGFDLPLPSKLNLLPMLTAVVMFINQKALTPQQAPNQENNPLAVNPKVMTYMMSGMFLLMLYSAPAGLNLYIMTSMVFGIAENWYVKQHYEELKAKGLLAPKDSKPGFFARMLEKVRDMQEQQAKLSSGKPARNDPDASSSGTGHTGLKKKKRK